MKTYNVYGLGNALLDMEYEISDDFLEKASVEKGLMTLVDDKRQAELITSLDGIKAQKGCGGSAANTIIAISQLGGKAYYSCKVAEDEEGNFFHSDLLEKGVLTNLGNNKPIGQTGKCLVMITPDAERTMNTFLGITATFSKKEIIEEELKKSEWIYIEGYLITSEEGKAASIYARELAKKHNIKTSLTFSDPMIVTHFKKCFGEVINDKIDLLFCNEQEALQYTESKSIEESIPKLKEVTNTFAITLGAKGALVFDGDKIHEISGHNVNAINTNGAGDLFAGSFMYGITNGFDYKKAGEFACEASAQLVQSYGARLTDELLLEIKAKYI